MVENAPVQEFASAEQVLPVLLGRKAEADVETGKVEVDDLAVGSPKYRQSASIITNLKCWEKIVLGFGAFFALAQGVVTPAIAMFTADSIKTLTIAGSDKDHMLDLMAPTLIKIGGLAAAQFVLNFSWQSCLAWAAAKQAYRWHRGFLEVLFCLDVSWYDENEPAGTASRLEADVANVYMFMSTALGYLISSVGQFIAGLSLAFVTGWQLALVVCATIPILASLGHRMGREIEQQVVDQQRNFARASAVAEESLMAIRTVAAFGAENAESARFEKELLSAKMGGIRSGVKIGGAWGGLNFFYSCLYGLALWFGGHILLSGDNLDFEPSHVVTVMIAMMVGVSGLSSFSGFAPAMAKAYASAISMKEVMSAAEARAIERPLYSKEALPEALSTVETLEFRNVSFRYPTRKERWVLSNLNFRVERGQKIAFVGESGCGKSTTIQLLERFYDPCAGEILVNGINLSQVPAKAWRKLIGYVGQEPVLFATSAMKNLKAGDDSISDEQVYEAAKAAQIYDDLMSLPEEFETFVGAGGGLLSGGQRQRVAIARALAKHPQILLLDEATSALDNESERLVQATLDSLNTVVGRSITTISIAHRLTTIKSSDVIYVLRDGRCCEQGSHEDLIERQGEYYSMAKLQQANAEDPEDQEETPTMAPPTRSETRKVSMKSIMSMQKSIALRRSGTALSLYGTGVGAEAVHVTPRVWFRLVGIMRLYWWVWPMVVVIIVLDAATMPLEALFFNAGILSLFNSKVEGLEAMYPHLDRAVLGLILVGLASGLAVLCQNSLFSYMQECLCMLLRKMTFVSTIRMDMAFFDAPENQTGSILVSLERHMNRVGQMLGIQLGNSTSAIFTCLISVGVSFAGSWVLALILLALMPICGFLGLVVAACATTVDQRQEDTYSRAGKQTAEAATSIRTVKALGAEEYTMEVLDELLLILTEGNTSRSWKLGLSLGLNMCMIQCIYLAGFGMSAACIQYWSFNAHEVLLTLFCVMFGVMSVSTIVQFIPDSASGYHAAAEVFRLIDQVSKIDATQPTGKIESIGDGSMEFKDVYFWYPHRPEVRVLKKLSFTIEKGQAVAFVGFSGSGKSTVIQLLQRFYDPQTGSVQVGGQNLCDLNVAFWRKQIGMVGQEPVLFDVSLEENVKYGYPEATDAQVKDAARVANMDYAFAGSVKWSDRVGLRGEKLSGGQKQRCAIARALLRRSQFLLLDEATSALDSTSERLVQQAMQEARVGKTTITVAHRLSTIQNSDKIFVMANGRIVESGTYHELINMDGSFAKLAARSL
ncbi:ABCB1 [Symbiodinium microadriaticum]|nr:ABCB1 [Symbiodinium microadriaticum]